MPALSNLLKRWGFVKLSRYGLVLLPEGRIMSLRPVMLDDGAGHPVVGWEDTDLAAAQLTKWEPARPAPAAAVAARVASPIALAPPPIPKAAVRMVTATHAAASAPLPALTPAARVVAPSAVVDIPPPVVSAPTGPVAPTEEAEDDWEWTIAIARARAAAEEVEQAVAPPPAPRKTRAASVPPPPVVDEPKVVVTPQAAVRPPLPASTMPAMPAPKRSVTRTAQMPSVSGPMESGRWPATETIGNIDYNDYSSTAREVARMSNVPKATPRQQPVAAPLPPNRVAPRAASPATVIPVPKLPSIKAMESAKLEPVIAARRLAAVKGTTPPPRKTTAQMTAVSISHGTDDDRTKPGITIPAVGSTPPANDDRTKPGITLPRAAGAVALPSITRRQA